MLTRKVAFVACAVLLLSGIVLAQIPGGWGVLPSGSIVAGNCAKWIDQQHIADAGKVCGGSVTPCTGAADYSVGCALLGGL